MSYHISVLKDEVIAALDVKRGGLYLDGTLGGGGHTRAILSRGGRVVAIDRDEQAIEYCKAHVTGNVTYIKGQYENAVSLLNANGIQSVSGAVLDLGVSSKQLDDGERGFSYINGGPLDMRMDRSQALSAYDVVNGYDENEIAEILRKYGEEQFARRIARSIVSERQKNPIATTDRLSEIITSSVPHRKGQHPAKKSFQAIRIEVNGELKGLYKAVTDVFSLIESGGKLAVITFHSLEDREVKAAYRELTTDCICPKYIPVCVCNHRALGKNARRVVPSESELEANPRARSATLRIIEKL